MDGIRRFYRGQEINRRWIIKPMKPVWKDQAYWISKDQARGELGVTELVLSRMRLRTIRERIDDQPVTLVNAADGRRAAQREPR